MVVGAGPSGLTAAREAARRGIEVLVLEEHEQVGLPVECAGLLSLRGLRAIGLKPSGRLVINRFRGALFLSPSGHELVVEGSRELACVVDRHELDQALAQQAESSGAEIWLGRKVLRAQQGPSGVVAEGAWGSVRAEVLVVAEGFRSRLVKQLGLTTIDWRYVLPASQVELEAPGALHEDFVELHFTPELAPGLFAWVIPLDGRRARVGLACRKADPRRRLRAFVKRRLGIRIKKAPYSGSVLTCGPIPKTHVGRALVVGDAAGQAKPTTGGGVVLGCLCAMEAGRVAAEALASGEVAEGGLKAYERAWRELLGREFKAMRLLRRALDVLPPRALDLAFKLASDMGLGQELPRLVDMDFQSSFLLSLPRLLISGLLNLGRRGH